MSFEIIWKKADSVRGCLRDQRLTTTRRRFSKDEDPLAVDNVFVSDGAKILASKAFRVLGDKT